jgi:primosomal protein N' (replication factor Y)
MNAGRMMRTVSVAVPVAVDSAFTYRVPADWDASPEAGERVLVSFGSRVLVGVVRPNGGVGEAGESGGEGPQAGTELKPVLARLDSGAPALRDDLVRLCEWISDYYLAPVGEAYRAALPGLLTNADARRAQLTDAGTSALMGAETGPLLGGSVGASKMEARLLAAVRDAGAAGLSLAALSRIRPRIPRAHAVVSRCESAGWISITVEEGVTKTRTETHLRRTEYLRGRTVAEPAIKAVVGRSKQRRALLDMLEHAEGWVSISELRSAFTRARQLIRPLIDAGLVAAEERPRELDPFASAAPEPTSAQDPTADQREALNALAAATDAREFRSFLLHGVTGSGKTEVYLQAIDRVRGEGGSAIVLVPEIALTPQLADRFRARFGDDVAVLHSGLTPRQRLDAWDQIRRGDRHIVIGARSAIFAPLPDLRMIVVDEEHDPSFKQEEGVRYNARDVALVRGRSRDAVVVLGSATPALESFWLAHESRHAYLRLSTRPTPRPLPEVQIVSLATHRPDPDTMMSAFLKSEVLRTVADGGQAILFLNRRGFTTSMTCLDCGAMQQCPDCSAPSMTYHLQRNRLLCHLCGFIADSPKDCVACGSDALVHGGGGTERVEIALSEALSEVRVLRLDRDTSRGRRLLETLDQFRARKADVLVGTQMLSKGHDFPGVTLVGILQGDHGLGRPDPRSAERTFQLLTQVAGRAGRGDHAGRVIIQAWATEHPALTYAAGHDYEGFAEVELVGRRELGNPPFGHLALLRVTGPDPDAVRARIEALSNLGRRAVRHVAEHADALAGASAEAVRVDVLGPVPSPIERINRRTRWQLLLRAPDRRALRWVLAQLRGSLGADGSGARETRAVVDVDPQTLL